MKKHDLIYTIALNAMICAAYAAFTFMIQPIAYREIQCRLSEVMVLLAFYNKKLTPGLVLGCLIANIPSSLGIIDWVVGPISTLIVCYFMYKLSNIYLGALAGSICTGVIIGAELSIVFHLPYIINAIYVFIGEAIVLFIGTFIFKRIEKNTKLMEYIKE